MEIFWIFLLLFNFCSGEVSWFFDGSDRTTLCHDPLPCEFTITKNYPLSPKIPSKFLYYNITMIDEHYFSEFYGYHMVFKIPENQHQKYFYFEAYDASSGENIIKFGDTIFVNTSDVSMCLGYHRKDAYAYSFEFSESLDNIPYVRLKFFGLSEDFVMNVELYYETKTTHYIDVYYGISCIILLHEYNSTLNKSDIENIEENTEEYKNNLVILDQIRDDILEFIKMFLFNIDIPSFGSDYFDSAVIYRPPLRIYVSYVEGLKYSSEYFFEPVVKPLFNSHILQGSINLDWGMFDKLDGNVKIANGFYSIYQLFQNDAFDMALKLVLQNDDIYFTIMYKNRCLIKTIRFLYGGELGPYSEVEIKYCIDDNDMLFEAALERVTSSIKEWYDNLDPYWQPFVLGVCIGVVIGPTQLGAAIAGGLAAAGEAVASVGNTVITGITVAGNTVVNWLNDVIKVDTKQVTDGVKNWVSQTFNFRNALSLPPFSTYLGGNYITYYK